MHVKSAYYSHKPNFRGLNNRSQIYKIVTKEHVYRTKICGGLDIFFSNTARFVEMTLGFLSRLAYNSGFLCKFAPPEPAKPLNDAQMCRSFYLKPSLFSSSTQIQTIIYSSPTDTNVGEFTNNRQENHRQRS